MVTGRYESSGTNLEDGGEVSQGLQVVSVDDDRSQQVVQ